MKKEKFIPTMSESAVHDNVAAIAPERIIDNKLFEQLQTLQHVKEECVFLFSVYSHQGVQMAETDEIMLYRDLDQCMRTLTSLASSKYEFDLKKGGAL